MSLAFRSLARLLNEDVEREGVDVKGVLKSARCPALGEDPSGGFWSLRRASDT